MAKAMQPVEAYLEIGKKKTFAGALDWPGWSRSGRGEQEALQTLLEYTPRYARVLQPAGIAFQTPMGTSDLIVVERLEGNATTDFGAPGIQPASDERPVNEDELHRLQSLLEACWQAFDKAAEQAAGKQLRKGPRGGGRDLEKIVQHVLDAQMAYLSALGWKIKVDKVEPLNEKQNQIRQAEVQALVASAHGELSERGPRGRARWKPRYFVRRSAWHILDHAWEIEDRMD